MKALELPQLKARVNIKLSPNKKPQ